MANKRRPANADDVISFFASAGETEANDVLRTVRIIMAARGASATKPQRARKAKPEPVEKPAA